MTQAQPSYMTKFRIFWEAADAVQAKRGEPPLGYEEARTWFDCEIDLADVPAVLGIHDRKEGGAPVTHPLRQWRKGRSITQETLAKEIDVVPSHICQIERRTRMPSLPLAARLAAHTGIPLVEFLPR